MQRLTCVIYLALLICCAYLLSLYTLGRSVYISGRLFGVYKGKGQGKVRKRSNRCSKEAKKEACYHGEDDEKGRFATV
jgi:hypothetical protein